MTSRTSHSPLLYHSPQTDQSITTSDKPAARRSRTIRACQSCRSKRIKCDSKRPKCSACEKSGIECIQLQADSTPTVDLGVQRILQRIDDLESNLNIIVPPLTTISGEKQSSPGDRSHELCLTIEGLLSWDVFQNEYDGRRDLKVLLASSQETQTLMSPASVEDLFSSHNPQLRSCTVLLDSFFHFSHVQNPMLDEEKVRQMVHRLFLEGPSWDAETCLALLVCAIGSLVSPFNASQVQLDAQSSAAAQSYFKSAQRRIGTVMGQGDYLEAQCHFYSGVYLMIQLKPLQAWQRFNQGLACCQQFTCANIAYQSLSRSPSPTRLTLPAQESVYWSCWKSEREVRIYLDLPDFAFESRSYPLMFPTPPQSVPADQAVAWYFYLSEISLIRLQDRIRSEIKRVLGLNELSLINELAKSTLMAEELAQEWTESLPSVMDLSNPQTDDSVLKFILRGHASDLWEVIYWPWLEMSMNRHLRTPKIQTFVKKGLQISIDRIRTNKPGFHHRHHGTWLMIQSCTRSALILLAAMYCTETVHLVPEAWQGAVADVLEMLRFWQYVAPDAADRLLILEELAFRLTSQTTRLGPV